MVIGALRSGLKVKVAVVSKLRRKSCVSVT